MSKKNESKYKTGCFAKRRICCRATGRTASIIEREDCINMILCIIVLAAAVRLAWIHDPQFHRGFLEEICSGLLTTIFFL